LEPSIDVGSRRLEASKKYQTAIVSENEEEPGPKRRKDEETPLFLGLDQFEGIRIGSLHGFQDFQIDARLLEYEDVQATDIQFASMWNHFRRRKKNIPDTQTFQAIIEFIELNIDHLQIYRLHLLQHLITLWNYRRISRDQLMQCMEFYDNKMDGTT